MTTEVSVDPDRCIGSGDCVRVAPAAFRIDEGAGVSRPLPGASDVDESVLLEAARTCPTQAIRLVTADGTVRDASN